MQGHQRIGRVMVAELCSSGNSVLIHLSDTHRSARYFSQSCFHHSGVHTSIERVWEAIRMVSNQSERLLRFHLVLLPSSRASSPPQCCPRTWCPTRPSLMFIIQATAFPLTVRYLVALVVLHFVVCSYCVSRAFFITSPPKNNNNNNK